MDRKVTIGDIFTSYMLNDICEKEVAFSVRQRGGMTLLCRLYPHSTFGIQWTIQRMTLLSCLVTSAVTSMWRRKAELGRWSLTVLYATLHIRSRVVLSSRVTLTLRKEDAFLTFDCIFRTSYHVMLKEFPPRSWTVQENSQGPHSKTGPSLRKYRCLGGRPTLHCGAHFIVGSLLTKLFCTWAKQAFMSPSRTNCIVLPSRLDSNVWRQPLEGSNSIVPWVGHRYRVFLVKQGAHFI